MIRSTPVVLLSTLLFAGSLAAEEFPIFQEENGILVVEIESADVVDDWIVDTTIGDFTGSNYYQWTGPNHFSINAAGNGTLTYHFTISTPGNYEFKWRSYIGIGDDYREHNDSWVRFPTGTNVDGEHPLTGWTKAYMNQIDDWTWNTSTVNNDPKKLRQYFTAGEHTIEIAGRSTGHVIDRFALFKYDEVNWHSATFTGFAESDFIVGSTTDGSTTDGSTTDGSTTDGSTTDGTTDGTTEPEPLPEWASTLGQLPLDECADNRVAQPVMTSIHTTDSGIANTGPLRIDDSQRTTFLKFDLTYIPPDLSDVTLLMNIGSDGGSGTINVSAGSHSDWTSSTADADSLPDPTVVIDSFLGQWTQNSQVGLPLDPALLGSEQLTLILNMQSGANDVSIDRQSTDSAPQLVFAGAQSNFCNEYALSQPAPDVDESTTDGATTGGSTGEPTDGEEPVLITNPPTDQANSGLDEGGSGSATAILLMMLLVVVGRRRESQPSHIEQ